LVIVALVLDEPPVAGILPGLLRKRVPLGADAIDGDLDGVSSCLHGANSERRCAGIPDQLRTAATAAN